MLHEGNTKNYSGKRSAMLERQLAARGIDDAAVLEALGRVPREQFVPEELQPYAYYDQPLHIGHGQTISQPYIVALMAQKAELSPDDRVLEVGTGSGYGAAVLGLLAGEVYSIERRPELAEGARRALARLAFDNVHVLIGNGWNGCPEHAPYDAIVVTAGAEELPPMLQQQLAVGGRLLIPLGRPLDQRLALIRRRSEDEFTREDLGPVAFVPFVKD